jgi:hypothetical protein
MHQPKDNEYAAAVGMPNKLAPEKRETKKPKKSKLDNTSAYNGSKRRKEQGGVKNRWGNTVTHYM